MALLFMDGFEGNDLSAKWTSVSGNTTSTGNVRFAFTGSRSYQPGTASKAIPETTQLTVGFAFNPNGATGTQGILSLYSNSGASVQLTLSYNGTTGLLSVARGGTTIATGTAVLPAGGWTFIEIQATLNATTGTVQTRINGSATADINFTGNTQNAAYTTFDQVTVTGNNIYLDDIYIADGTSGHNNSFLGDVRVYPLSPNGAGASSQFTPTGAATGWQATDALPVQSTTYVSDGTSGQADLYTLGALPAGVSAVLGVQSNVYMAKSDAGAIQGKGLIRAGSTTFSGAPRSVSTTYATYSDVYDQNPNTVAPWAVSDIASLQAGVGVV